MNCGTSRCKPKPGFPVDSATWTVGDVAPTYQFSDFCNMGVGSNLFQRFLSASISMPLYYYMAWNWPSAAEGVRIGDGRSAGTGVYLDGT